MHFIRKISIDALSSCEKTGRQLNEEINTLITDELTPKLATLLDKYSADTVVTAIESISISLPPISIKNWKKEFVSGCLEQIESFLDKHYTGKALHTASSEISLTVFNSQSMTEKYTAAPNDHFWKAILHFLQTGIIENKEVLKIMQESNLFKEEIPEKVAEALKDLLASDNNAFVRLVLNSPVNFKNVVLTKLIPDYKYNPAIEAVLKSGGISFNSATRQSGWIAILLLEFYFFRSGISIESKRLMKITESYFNEIAPKFSEVIALLIENEKQIVNSKEFLIFLELQTLLSQKKRSNSGTQVSPKAETSEYDISIDNINSKEADAALQDYTDNANNSNLQEDSNAENPVLHTSDKQSGPEINVNISDNVEDFVTKSATLFQTKDKHVDIADGKKGELTENESTSKNSHNQNSDHYDIAADDTIANKIKQPESSFDNTLKENYLPDTVYINNGGLILLFPFLSYLFQNTGLTIDNKWKSVLHQQKAVLLTQYCVTGNTDFRENDLLLNKLLCGYALFSVVDTTIQLSDTDKEQCREMLQSVIHYWEALKNSSPEALQETFLQREAKLNLHNEVIEMWVENKAFDILLQRLPWSIAMVKTVWMDKMIQCNWY
ncbi:contractile injection system tape measure protein [Flavobacterium sp.]|uniref:contractile injection system tape measure protein n=1 Tax=Flavobacterium sp. TaxID=239 RepID=UPI002612A951|nr:contractile injection system tape measure protein [Flavobacterium sp.]